MEYWKQFILEGNPAFRKQEETWTAQFAAAVEQEPASLKGAKGLEHQLPHWYSQVGVGEMTVVEVQRDAVMRVLVLVLAGELVGRGVVVQDVDAV